MSDLTPAEQVEEALAAANGSVEEPQTVSQEEPAASSDASLTDVVEFELTSEPAVEEPEPVVPVVLSTEHGWTAQSSHGVLLPEFVPTDNYQALDAPEHQAEDVSGW